MTPEQDKELRGKYPANVEGSAEFNEAAEYERAEEELKPLIEAMMAPAIMRGHNLTVEKIVRDTINTKKSFDLPCDLSTILAGEIPYYVKYGMNAFDTGYTTKFKKD